MSSITNGPRTIRSAASSPTSPIRRPTRCVGWRSANSCSSPGRRLAHGWRHLTVVHGDPTDLAASRQLSAFYDTLPQLKAGGRARICGNIIGYVTVTVDGPHADGRVAKLAASAAADPATGRSSLPLSARVAQLTALVAGRWAISSW